MITALRTLVICFAIGIFVFGLDSYRAWFRAMLVSSDWAWASMNSSVFAVFLRLFGQTPYFTPAWFEPRFIPFWIAAATAGGANNVGAVMGKVMAQFKGKAEGGVINAIVREELAKQTS